MWCVWWWSRRDVYDMSLSIPPNVKHQIMGVVSLWTRPPALYLCTRPYKIPTHRVRALQLRDQRSVLRSEPPSICRCTQRACNNVVQARIRRAATVGTRLSSHRLHPRNLLDMLNRDIDHRGTEGKSLYVKTGMSTTSEELQLRNSGTSRQLHCLDHGPCRNDNKLV